MCASFTVGGGFIDKNIKYEQIVFKKNKKNKNIFCTDAERDTPDVSPPASTLTSKVEDHHNSHTHFSPHQHQPSLCFLFFFLQAQNSNYGETPSTWTGPRPWPRPPLYLHFEHLVSPKWDTRLPLPVTTWNRTSENWTWHTRHNEPLKGGAAEASTGHKFLDYMKRSALKRKTCSGFPRHCCFLLVKQPEIIIKNKKTKQVFTFFLC